MDKEYLIYIGDKVKKEKFENDQYEEFYSDKFGYEKGTEARYILQEELDYQDNQLIEALPPILTMSEFVERVEKEPAFDESERFKPDKERIHSIARLGDVFHVFMNHIRVENQLSIIIRRGYVSKCISSINFRKNLQTTANLINNKDKGNVLDEFKCLSYGTSPQNAGFTIYGPSGMGKTTTINTILGKCYPQYIIHTNYKGAKILFRQLVWLRMDCSHNGSIKGICKKFFEEVDNIIGTNYSSNYSRKDRTVDDMIAGMAHIVQLHGLGVLIIDELQHIAESKANKREVLNFLVTLQNELKLPIIFIGTYKLVNEVLKLDYRQARRASGIGEIELGFLEENCLDSVEGIDEWSDFVEELWKYQWTQKKTLLTPKLKKVLYEESVGIIDRVIKIFMVSQINAITQGNEEITVELIRKASNQQMKLSKEMIDAVRKRDLNTLKRFGDLYSFDFNQFVETSLEKAQDIQTQNEFNGLKNNENYKSRKRKRELMNSVSNLLTKLGINEVNSARIAKEAINKTGIKVDEAELNKEAIKMGLSFEKQINSKNTGSVKKTKKIKRETEDSDSIYEKYIENGKIKSPETDFDDN